MLSMQFKLTHEYNRHVGTERLDFWMPLTRYIFERTTSTYGETDQETISLQRRKEFSMNLYTPRERCMRLKISSLFQSLFSKHGKYFNKLSRVHLNMIAVSDAHNLLDQQYPIMSFRIDIHLRICCRRSYQNCKKKI